MDKRTVLFIIALSLTLFLVNLFFERQNQDKLRTWNAQQEAKKIEKVKLLQEETAKHTASAADLPIVPLFLDPQGKEWSTDGVKIGETILVLSPNNHPPATLYLKSNGDFAEYKLNGSADKAGTPILYQSQAKAPLSIAPLPEFGTFDLQLVVPHPENKEGLSIVLGEWVDGHFSIPQDRIATLEGKKDTRTIQTNAIALLKAAEGYLPVGIYNAELNTLQSIDAFLAIDVKKPETKKLVTAGQKGEERFFVIENDYQQFVFSNYGGALAEINLPFKTETNQKSVVLPIEIDVEMKKDFSFNDYYPAHAFSTAGKDSKGPFVETAKGKLGGYYPLLRRDVIFDKSRPPIRIKPTDYALNIVSEYPEIAELVYDVTYFDGKKIVFETAQNHRKIKKTFSTEPESKDAPYVLNLEIEIEGDARGLWLTSGVPEVEMISGSPAPALKYRVSRNQKSDVENVDLPKDALTFSTVKPDWVTNSNGFMGMIIDPLNTNDMGFRAQMIPGTVVPTRLIELGQQYEKYKPQDFPGYEILLPLNGNGGKMQFRYFAGPFATDILKAVDTVYSDKTTGYNPDYIASQTFHGWFSFISEPFAKFLFVLMNFFHTLTNSWGLSIILLTIALRIMMYPLNAWSTKSMLKMQQINPEVVAIQEKYKKDPKKAQMEIMNLYRERGVNPVSGCLPLLIQMPFLIGMFDLLKSTFELRGASFIPGWIDNLTAPDVLFSWTTPLPFIGNQFHLLPILLGAVMFLQQRMMATGPKDVNQMTEQQRQQKVMGNMMAVVFTIMFYHFPSGLNIYWLSSMLLGMLQQWWTQRKMATAVPVVVAEKGKKKG